MKTRFVEIDTLTAYPASCLVRDLYGRPKTLNFGNTLRGRVSSAAIKRAVRTSESFADALSGNLGVRTRRAGVEVIKVLEAEFGREKAVEAGMAIAAVFGKVDEAEEPGVNRQLSFVSGEEVESAIALARRIAAGEIKLPPKAAAKKFEDADAGDGAEKPGKKKRVEKSEEEKLFDTEIKKLIRPNVKAVDIALFGRMFADQSDMRMTAAASVQHPFTVGKAVMESDFYVAKDDRGPVDESGAGFMGNQEFVSGLFHGYWRIDMQQLVRNLGGDEDLALRGLEALLRSIPVVTPSGKSASFGTHARALWAMVRVGRTSQDSLAAAFLSPVEEGDQLEVAKNRLLKLSDSLGRAYGDKPERAVMDVMGGSGSVEELVSLAINSFKAA